jgi:flagellar basal-body rod protein FlgG
MSSLETGATGMMAQQLNVDVISNNIANLTTTGFKRSRAEFQDLLYQSTRRVGTTSSDSGTIVPAGVQVGARVQAAGVYRINEQGNIQITNNPLDMAINGAGYFQITLPDGTTGYTRDGSFQLNQQGTIVTQNGYTLQPDMTVPINASSIQVDSTGQVQITIQGQQAATTIGQITLATFANPAGLEAVGGDIYRVSGASGDPNTGNPGAVGYGTITGGALENSNVNIVSEITNLITAQRAYEMNSKVVQASSEMLSTLNSTK